MSGSSEAERLKALEARIAAAKQAQAPIPHTEEHYSQAHLAWRMVIELVAGLGIGFGIGFGLDALLGSTPWLMMVFTILGFIAGVKTMIRSAEEVQRKQVEAAGAAATDGATDAVAKDGATDAVAGGTANEEQHRGNTD